MSDYVFNRDPNKSNFHKFKKFAEWEVGDKVSGKVLDVVPEIVDGQDYGDKLILRVLKIDIESNTGEYEIREGDSMKVGCASIFNLGNKYGETWDIGSVIQIYYVEHGTKKNGQKFHDCDVTPAEGETVSKKTEAPAETGDLPTFGTEDL